MTTPKNPEYPNTPMNTANPEDALVCEHGISAATLSAWRDHDLPDEKTLTIGAHIAICAACQKRLAEYDALIAALRAQPAPLVDERLALALRDIPNRSNSNTSKAERKPLSMRTRSDDFNDRADATTPARPQRTTPRRRPLAALISVAAVLALVVASVAVFGALAAQRGKPPKPVVKATSTPNIPGSETAGLPQYYRFNAIQTLAPDDIWAVGGSYSKDCSVNCGDVASSVSTLFAHYDGHTWTVVPGIYPGAEIYTLSMDSSSDGWATGGIVGNGMNFFHYTGGKWRQVQTPLRLASTSTITFTKIIMRSPGEGWAFGVVQNISPNSETFTFTLTPTVMRYSHGLWSVVTTTLPAISDATYDATGRLWVAGDGGLVAYYDGSQWVSSYHLGHPGSDIITSLSVVSPTDIWAAGYTKQQSKGIQSSLVLHFDGANWSQVTIPALGAYAYNTQIQMVSANEGWLVTRQEQPGASYYLYTQTPMLLHYLNGQWQQAQIPEQAQGAEITSVSMLSATDGWALGDNFNDWNAGSCGNSTLTSGHAPVNPLNKDVALSGCPGANSPVDALTFRYQNGQWSINQRTVQQP